MSDIEELPLPKCLIVDDLKENILALKGILADEEVEIHSATSGLEALELLLKHEFALALIDVQMPGMDGFELAETMRSTERTKSIPIIFVTAASTDAQRIFRGYEAGAVDFMHKPLYPQIVVSKIRIFLELYRNKRQLERKLERIKETEANLQEALRSRDEFLSIASHELKTPLTSLKMQIQLQEHLSQKRGEEFAYSLDKIKKFIEQADKSVERIIHLVNDMLDISRVTTGRLSLNLEEVELTELAQEVTERLRPLLDMSCNEVTFDFEPGTRALVDRFRIEQVLTNLLINAAKYAPNCEVDVKVKKENDKALIIVGDHGQGIPPEDQKRIFQRFERAVSPNKISGLGLGLFISRGIIEMHKGNISVHSDPGKGATFTVSLPLV